MNENVVYMFRTLACRSRLDILSFIIRAGETAPTIISSELALPLDLVCNHLRRLELAGLIRRRPSGVWSFCRPNCRSTRKALSARLISWLQGVLVDPRRALEACGILSPSAGPETASALLHGVIFEAATAFTHRRRLQILRRLLRGHPETGGTLTRQLHMSPAALSRHMKKLIRRGYVVRCSRGPATNYRLADGYKSPIHTALFKMISQEWTAGNNSLHS